MEKIKIGNRGSKPHEPTLWKSAARGMLGAFLLALLLLFFFSFLSYKSANPGGGIQLYSYGILAITSLFCGFLSARTHKKRGLLSGISAGILFLSVLIIVSFFFREDSFPFGKSILIYLAVLLLSTLGGIIGANRKQKRRHINRQ